VPFGFGHALFHLDDAVRVERDGINADLDKEGGKFGIIARCLTTDAHFTSCLMGSGDKMADQTLERLVALVKQRTDVLP
jgi:hypothetical protein